LDPIGVKVLSFQFPSLVLGQMLFLALYIYILICRTQSLHHSANHVGSLNNNIVFWVLGVGHILPPVHGFFHLFVYLLIYPCVVDFTTAYYEGGF